MCEQVVELSPHLQNSCGRPLVDHILCNDLDQGLPVWRWYGSLFRDLVAGNNSQHRDEPRVAVYPYFCACTASYINNALLKFLPHSLATLSSNPEPLFRPSFSPTPFNTPVISCTLGAATLTSKHLLLIGAMMLLVLLASRMRRKLGLYFSMVRRRAACASRVRWSASLITTTLKRCLAARSTCCV